jgi:hypothetical protein
VISFDFALAGSESVEWTKIQAEVVFKAAVGDVDQGKIYLAKAGALYVADMTQKKPRAVLLSQFDETIEFDRMKFDKGADRIFGIDREGGILYAIDLDADPPTPELIASDLGLPFDFDVSESHAVLIVDATGRRVLELDCSQAGGCSDPTEFAAIPEFRRPFTVVRDAGGTTWVGDYDAQKIFAFDSKGNVTRVLSSYAGFSD